MPERVYPADIAMTLVHLSHTDIRIDSRILKELKAIAGIEGYECVAIGVSSKERTPPAKEFVEARIVSIPLYSRFFRILPRVVRHGLSLVELTFVLVYHCLLLKPKLVHCHDTVVLPAGILIKIFTGCKLVYDAHELESQKSGQSRFSSRATFRLETLCWSRVDTIISVSESIIDWYIEHFGPKKHILVLNSPEVGEAEDHQDSSFDTGRYFHEKYHIQDDEKIFVYLGILAPGRGIELCLEAFSDSAIRGHVVFIGYGALAELIEEYSLQHGNIHLHPPVPHDQVVNLVKSADCGLCLVENVSLSDYYCLPNKLFEYCFAGLSVLASNFPEISKLVDRYSLGMTCELDPEKIRESVVRFIEEPPGHIQADLSELSWKVQAERLMQGYGELLSSATVS